MARSVGLNPPFIPMSTLAALSNREAQVLALAAKGLIDKEISCRLGLSLNTLRTYWRRIREKTGASTRAALVATWVDYRSQQEVMPSEWSPFRRFEVDLDIASPHEEAAKALILGVQGNLESWPDVRSVHPDDFSLAAKQLLPLLTGKEWSVSTSYRVIYQSNVYVTNTLLTSVRDGEGRVSKLIGYAIDRLEARLAERPGEHPGQWIGGLHADHFRADPGMCAIFGLDPVADSSKSRLFRDRVNPDDYARLRRLSDEADRMGGGVVSTNMRVHPKPGVENNMFVQALIERQPTGEPLIIGQYVPGRVGEVAVEKL